MHLSAITNFITCLSAARRRSGLAELSVASCVLRAEEVQAIERMELRSLKNTTIPEGQNWDLGGVLSSTT